MLSEEKWRAIGERGQPRRRAVALGPLVRQQVERLQEAVGAPLGEIRDCLQGMMGANFEAHCRLVSLKGGRLTVAVDDPARLDMIRREYLFVLRERLAELAPGVLITDVVWTVYRER